jgi:capsular polysaccharide biosynthesis protein
MELRRYLSILRHRLPLIAVTVAIALVAGYLITPRVNRYTATATIYVGDRSPNIGPTSNINVNQQFGLDRLIATWTITIRSSQVAQNALAATHVPRSVGAVSAETSAAQIPNTNLLNVSVTDTDPAIAQALANGVANGFIDYFTSLNSGTDTQQYLNVQQPAGLPFAPNDNGLKRNLILAGILGLVAAIAVVALLEYVDITIRAPEDVERRLELPVLAAIPRLGTAMPTGPVLRIREAPTRRREAPRSGRLAAREGTGRA